MGPAMTKIETRIAAVLLDGLLNWNEADPPAHSYRRSGQGWLGWRPYSTAVTETFSNRRIRPVQSCSPIDHVALPDLKAIVTMHGQAGKKLLRGLSSTPRA